MSCVSKDSSPPSFSSPQSPRSQGKNLLKQIVSQQKQYNIKPQYKVQQINGLLPGLVALNQLQLLTA